MKSRETKTVNMILKAYTPRLSKFNYFNKNGLFGRDRGPVFVFEQILRPAICLHSIVGGGLGKIWERSLTAKFPLNRTESTGTEF